MLSLGEQNLARKLSAFPDLYKLRSNGDFLDFPL